MVVASTLFAGSSALMGSAIAAPPDPASGAAATPEDSIVITTRLTPEPSSVGDRLDLRVIAAYPRGYSVNLPTGFGFGKFHVIDSTASEPESGGRGLRKTFHVFFQSFDTGVQRTPKFELTYVDPQGQVQTIAVPPHEFEVRALLENEVDPARQSEDAPVSLEYPNERAELIIYVAAGTLVFSLLAWWAIARLRRREREAYVAPPVPAHLVALEALEVLDAQRESMIEHGEFPDYYVELTRILKGYVEGRFDIEALDRTTDELRRALQQPELASRLSDVEPEAFMRFLQSCDLIKFARFSPTPEEAEAALVEVREIVQRTKPKRPQPAVDGEGDGESDGESDGEGATQSLPEDPPPEDPPPGEPPTGGPTPVRQDAT